MPRRDLDDDHDDHAAPPGSVCRRHPDRAAIATCPSCGANVCFECWHIALRLCDACVRRDPAAAGPPVPWEDPERRWLGGLFATLVAARHPTRTSPAFARPELGRAVVFAVLTLPLLAAASGVIPFTHTLSFEPGWVVRPIGSPAPDAIVSDVIHAAGIGLLSILVLWLGIALPYTSLLRAYGEPGAGRIGLRMLLYRGWLLALFPGQLLVMPAMLSIPEMSVDAMQLGFAVASILFGLLPSFLFFVALSRTARIAAGVGPIASFVVSLVPVVFGGLAWSVLDQLMTAAGWFPTVSG